MNSETIYIYDNEADFAVCLSELFEICHRCSAVITTKDELAVLLKSGQVELLLCDLSSQKEAEILFHMLNEIDQNSSHPTRVAFTSVYEEAKDWIQTSYSCESFLFLAKPFHSFDLIHYFAKKMNVVSGF